MKVILSICKEHNKKQKTKNKKTSSLQGKGQFAKAQNRKDAGRYNTNNVKIRYKQYTRLVNGVKTISGYVH